LARGADSREYSSDVVREISRRTREHGVTIPSEGERTLRVTRDCKIRVVEQIVGIHAKSNLRAFRQSEGLLERQIKFRERRATEAIAGSSAELPGGWQRKCTWIKPARWRADSTAIRANTRIRIANEVWPFRYVKGLQIGVVKGKHWSKRHIAVNPSEPRDLPATEDAASVSKRQLVNNVADEIMPDVES